MKQDFKSITRGGQTFLHSLRMINQILRMVLISSGAIFLVTAVCWFMIHTTAYERYLYRGWLFARALYAINPHSTQKLKEQNGVVVKVYNYAVLQSPTVQAASDKIQRGMITALWIGIMITLPFSAATLVWFSRRGKKFEETELIKGSYVTTPDKMNKLLAKSGRQGDLTLGDIRLHEKAELQHFLIHGTTGTGKSYLIRTLLYQIRKRGNKAIVYDKHGTFVEKFYNPDTDIILNPMDVRCAPWHIWAECRDDADFESMATAMMPMPPSQAADPFWVNAARTIFACLSIKMRDSNIRSTKELLRYLFSANLNVLENMLKGTEAETLVSEKTEKTALSVKSVLSTYIKGLKYLKDADEPFSIRQWVADESQTGWLFISSRTDKHESLKPLISTWLDVAANALMSLPENSDRRLWMVIDELSSLQRLPYLPATFAESRKFGGCLIAGLQNYFQLQKIYGQDGAKEIIDLCNIRAFFRAPSNDVAKWVSREIGEAEQLEAREGISYGANTVRDGVTLNHQTVTRPAVSATEISNLPDLNGFVSIPPLSTKGKSQLSWPVTRIKLAWQEHISHQPAYVELPIIESESIEEELEISDSQDENNGDLAENLPKPKPKNKRGNNKGNDVVVDDLFQI